MGGVSLWLRELLFPRKCMLCGRLLTEEQLDMCPDCRSEVPEYPHRVTNSDGKGKNNLHFLDSFIAVWYYEGNVRNSIRRFKFGRAIHLAPKFGRLLAMKLLTAGVDHFDVLTWVPVSRARRRQRGFDQCELLAKSVASELGVTPVRLLRKIRNTPPQSGISSPDARKANVLGAFKMLPDADVRGKVILLLDDVYTTGATTEECARVLLSAGAKEVHCAAIARAAERK